MKDALKQDIEVGDIIAVAQRDGNTSNLALGVVYEVNEQKVKMIAPRKNYMGELINEYYRSWSTVSERTIIVDKVNSTEYPFEINEQTDFIDNIRFRVLNKLSL
jgi:hypothetical protein